MKASRGRVCARRGRTRSAALRSVGPLSPGLRTGREEGVLAAVLLCGHHHAVTGPASAPSLPPALVRRTRLERGDVPTGSSLGYEIAGGAGDLPSPAGSGPHCLQPDDGPVSGHLDGDVVNEMACHPQPSTGQLVRYRGPGHRHGRPGTPVLDLETSCCPSSQARSTPAPEPCATLLAAASWTASTTSAACSRSTPVNIHRTTERTWDNWWTTVNSSRPRSRPPAGLPATVGSLPPERSPRRSPASLRPRCQTTAQETDAGTPVQSIFLNAMGHQAIRETGKA